MQATYSAMTTSHRHDRLGRGLAAILGLCLTLAWAPAVEAGMFQDNWDGALDSRVTLGGNATQIDGHIRLTEAANGQSGSLTLDDLDPGQAVTAFTASMKVFIGGGSGADGMSFNFGDSGTLDPINGVSTGLAVRLDTYDNGGGDVVNAIEIVYNGTSVATGAGTTLRTGSYVALDVRVYPDGFIHVQHDNNVTEATIPGWSGVTGRQFVWGAGTGGINDEHSVEDVTIATFNSGAYYEDFSSAPVANVTFYGNAHQDDFYARLTDNAGSQQGSFVLDDLDPGTAVDSFSASFDKYIWNGGGADGVSFNFGDLAAASFGEGGSGNGLIVSWPTYKNDKVRVYYGGSLIHESGARSLRGIWTRVSVAVDSAGHLFVTDTADGNSIAVLDLTIPGWNPQAGWRFGVGGRTGGITDDHAVDKLSIQTGVCGNGAVDDGEECDDSNTADGDCCSASCQFESSGSSCGDTGSECVVQDTCDGAGSCTDNGFVSSGTSCGDATDDECTNPDTCDGAGACQDNHETSGTACGDAGTECTVQDTCDGSGACTDNGFVSSGTSCGDATDDECTNPDTCDGAGACQDNHETSGTACGDAGTECTVQDTCDGSGACTDNGFATSGTACGDAGTECTVQDTCNGSGACTDNGFATSGTACGDAGTECTVQDTCNGSGACTDNGFENSGTSCGDATDDECTDPDTCDGAGSCQDNHAGSGTACGDAGTECTVQDTCDGSGACTDNGFESSGTSCGDATDDECTDPDTCDGNGACQDNHAGSGTACGDAGTECTVQDTCDGDGACTDNGFVTAGAACGDGSDTDCDNPDTCDGAGACQVNNETAGVTCRPADGDCDAEETCDGAGNCPVDGSVANGTACDDGNVCTIDDVCTDGVCAGSLELCGDGSVQGACGEECDDGNTDPGDGCDAVCLEENCPATAIVGCAEVAGASLAVSEKSAGKESLKVQWKKLADASTEGDLGDPVTGATAISVCLYDDAGMLVQAYNVDRPGADCDGKPCWKAKEGKGWSYKDKTVSADGMSKLAFAAGDADKGKAAAAGKNNASKGQSALPTGIVAQLTGQSMPTVQLVASDGACVTATMNEVKKDDGLAYQAQKK